MAIRKLQLTLAILKPDLVANPAATIDVRNVILRNKFYIVQSKKIRLSRAEAEDFYVEHAGKFFYNRLVNFISSGPIIVNILARHDARNFWRTIMGPTKVYKTVYTAPNSLRGQFGLTDTRNSVHGSDSEKSAIREINFFYPSFNIENWYEEFETDFRQSSELLTFDPAKGIHIPKIKPVTR